MPNIDFNGQAQALCSLLAADAVLYWRMENADLAVPLGATPAGTIGKGFRPPACADGVHLLRGGSACALIPLRMRGNLDGDTCTVLAGLDGKRGGILAVWHRPGSQPHREAEAIMGFALATLRPQLGFAAIHWEMQQTEARRLSGMADALPQGVIVVPSGNRPGYVNQMAAALLDLPHGTVEASQLSSKLAEFAQRTEDADTVRSQVKRFIAGHGNLPLSGQVWHFRNRSPSALRVTVAPIDREQAAGWLWLLEDVSAAEAEAEARERQRRLEWLNNELEKQVSERTGQLEHSNEVLLQANIELQHFAHAMAHDLQTPLRSIAGFAQLVQKRVKQYGIADVDDWTAQVIDNTRRLQALIQGLLAYTRVDAQAIRAEEADTNEVFDEVAKSLRAMIDETKAEVSRAELPTVPCVRSQIGQVLQNLIENGLKYNTATPPKVFVSCERQGESWLFSVSDNGMGIDPKYHERIFGMFDRLHGYGQIPGTGIGLALCRRIVERHGGRIWVESREKAGATFYFTLPVERAASDVRPRALQMQKG